MGGLGSGRRAGKPYTVEDCLVFDLSLLMRHGLIRHGQVGNRVLRWTYNGTATAAIICHYDLVLPGAELRLNFEVRSTGGIRQNVEQRITVDLTCPNYGGVRWWMRCPITRRRAAKLYLPPGEHSFAARTAWGLPYDSQRESAAARQFRRLGQVQRKMGIPECWETPLYRRKGMWRRTFRRYAAVCWPLQRRCRSEMSLLESLMGADQ